MRARAEDPESRPGLAMLDPAFGWPTLISYAGEVLRWYQHRASARPIGFCVETRGRKGVWVPEATVVGAAKGRQPGREGWGPGTVLRVRNRLAVVVMIHGHQYPVVDILGFLTANPEMARGALWAAVAGAMRLDTLIIGPTGTGKERIAQVVYRAFCVANAEGPFVPLNMGALTPSLFASELFGHERGAFTGAERSSPGAFRCANGGVLFLDEIGEAAPCAQVALLRAIENREVRPVGAQKSVPVDVVVVSATNQKLNASGGVVRQDLVHRLAGAVVRLGPLRDRVEDILPIARHALDSQGFQGDLTPGAASLLMNAPWEGNVRELLRVLRQASALSGGKKIEAATVQLALQTLQDPQSAPVSQEFAPLDKEILRIGALSPGSRGQAWRRLGMAKSTFYRRLRWLRSHNGVDAQSDVPGFEKVRARLDSQKFC